MSDPNIIVAYHNNCNDGKMAAFVAWKSFEKNCYTVPVNYHLHKLPVADVIASMTACLPDGADLKKIQLFVVDFCFPTEMLVKFGETFDIVVVLDHHVTAEENLKGVPRTQSRNIYCGGWAEYTVAENVSVSFTMEESGALMAWNYFHPGESAADFIHYTSDRDLWKFLDPNSRPFGAGMSMYRSASFEELDVILDNVPAIVATGKAIMKVEEERIASTLKNPATILLFTTGTETFEIGVYNAPADITSSLLNQYVTTEGNPKIGMTYTIGSNNTVYCSVRSAKGVSSVGISSALGGGGHPEANGFTLSLEDLFESLTSGVLQKNAAITA